MFMNDCPITIHSISANFPLFPVGTGCVGRKMLQLLVDDMFDRALIQVVEEENDA